MEIELEYRGDKFGGEMDFGSCLNNSAVKFIDVLDEGTNPIRIPYRSTEEPLIRLKEYYSELFETPSKHKFREVIFKGSVTGKHYFPYNRFTINNLIESKGKIEFT